MIQNYIKIAWRSLLRNKFFSIINIFGLAIGLCSFLLITLYITDELSYDKHFVDAERIFRINSDINFGGTNIKLSQSGDPMGAVLKKDFPQVEQFTRIYTNEGSNLVKKGTDFIEENRIAYVDSTFFDMFSISLIEGDKISALNNPNSAALSKSLAIKYFNSYDVVGRSLEVGVSNKTIYTINAVYDGIPANSHFNFDILLSMDNVNYTFGNFLSHNFNTYIKLKEGINYKDFNKNFETVIKNYILPQAKQAMDLSSIEEFRKSGNDLQYSLFPITDIHLKSDRSFEIGVMGNIQYVYIFGIVALFLLIIACINFINLTTARSTNRAKEVGVRKAFGTERYNLIGQFLAESTLTSFISMVIAMLLIALLLPKFNEISSKTLAYSNLFSPKFLPFLFLLPIFVGLIAGYYPAFIMSSFKPIEAFRQKINTGFLKSNIRSLLVIVQFVVTLILIIGTVVVYQQLNYIQSKNVGFNKDQILIVDGTSALMNNIDAFKNEVLSLGGVKAGSQSQYLPVANSARSDDTFFKDASLSDKNGISMQVWRIDSDYIPTLEMEMAQGRNFSKEFISDSNAVIINETAAKMLGYKDPLNQNIYKTDNNNDEDVIAMNIVGVVKNFHYESLRENIGPLCFRLSKSRNGMIFKIASDKVNDLVKTIESKWKYFAPGMPFSYRFMDESFEEIYRSERRIGSVALIFAILTIFIASLGLIGLVTYMTEQRVKEIGVRKVLGANELNIVFLIMKGFLKLVLISIIIGSPISYFVMQKWLEDFAFSTPLNWWVFLLAGFITIAISILTVSYHSIKAALMNPVISLKTE